ncbi:hypothetical protein DINM_003564 [Dirofilaria immitis]|nr:hypothetical protein [Dirofilaria immitis]
MLLKGDFPSNTWRIGRIDRLIRDQDGICRSVVRIANGNDLVRAIRISIHWSPTENKISHWYYCTYINDLAITAVVDDKIYRIGASIGADIGGSSKYSSEILKTEVEKGST